MRTIAPILKQTVSKIRFRVDAVKPAQENLPVRNAKLQLDARFEKQLLAFSHDDAYSVIHSHGIHPLIQAVHTAFSDHRPLLLTPDMIWITLAQGFAQHINDQAEALRSRFVRHQGKQNLVIESLQIPSQSQHWSEAIQQWTLLIRDQVGADLYRLLECNFSTTTPITRTASHVVMMDTFKKYFNYGMDCICGIPEITLMGTVEDWQSIYDRVQQMAQYELGWWTDRVLPICQEFIKTAAGKPSLKFWQAIYKPREIYGGELITGWSADLFPYLEQSMTQTTLVRNPILSIDRVNLTVENGITPSSLPLGLSQVPIKLKTADGENSLELIAGFIGVHQAKDGTLHPEIGWAVVNPDPFTQVLNKIQAHSTQQVPINWHELSFDDGIISENIPPDSIPEEYFSIPKEYFQLFDRFNGSTLYANSGHSWKFANYHSGHVYTTYRIDVLKYCGPAIHLADLEDGRCIIYLEHSSYGLGYKRWVILGTPTKSSEPAPPEAVQFKLENILVLTENIRHLFERIFESEGSYYFDDPDFVPLPVNKIILGGTLLL